MKRRSFLKWMGVAPAVPLIAKYAKEGEPDITNQDLFVRVKGEPIMTETVYYEDPKEIIIRKAGAYKVDFTYQDGSLIRHKTEIREFKSGEKITLQFPGWVSAVMVGNP